MTTTCLIYITIDIVTVYDKQLGVLLGTSPELHKPTNETVINPLYHTITDDHKIQVGEPINYYEEVKKPPEVKMTPNPAYAVP